MTSPQEIAWFGLAVCGGLMLIPLTLDRIFKLRIFRPVVTSLLRMCVQLFLMGVYLKYLLTWDLPLLNAAWFLAIIVVASNILVQFLFGQWLTWGAFTYPLAFLVTFGNDDDARMDVVLLLLLQRLDEVGIPDH